MHAKPLLQWAAAALALQLPSSLTLQAIPNRPSILPATLNRRPSISAKEPGRIQVHQDPILNHAPAPLTVAAAPWDKHDDGGTGEIHKLMGTFGNKKPASPIRVDAVDINQRQAVIARSEAIRDFGGIDPYDYPQHQQHRNKQGTTADRIPTCARKNAKLHSQRQWTISYDGDNHINGLHCGQSVRAQMKDFLLCRPLSDWTCVASGEPGHGGVTIQFHTPRTCTDEKVREAVAKGTAGKVLVWCQHL
ncbi:hypothetical protein B0H63DRAFT_75498 [Podospora didyma]|uniref:Uncharacterized protein n=1 Tax=Podospora didyma TaxID=330526 RepID=A0AAE0N311_9PEZI|nr:hypothetical protein B0H63DRAFT_75498 [Podospora didyma]